MCHSSSGSAERLGDLLGEHGLAGAGLALHQQRALQGDRGVDRELEVVGGDVGVGALEAHWTEIPWEVRGDYTGARSADRLQASRVRPRIARRCARPSSCSLRAWRRAAEAAPLVAVDVGHYLAEPGATSARGRPELEFNRELAIELARAPGRRAASRAMLIGADGDMTVLSRADRPPRARRRSSVSVHHDSVQPHYLEDWEHDGRGAQLQRPLRRLLALRFASQSAARAEPARAHPRSGRRCAGAGFAPSLYHAEPIPGESKPFADRANGVHYYDNLVVLHSATQPAVLLEAGVIVNRAEELALRDPATQRLDRGGGGRRRAAGASARRRFDPPRALG